MNWPKTIRDNARVGGFGAAIAVLLGWISLFTLESPPTYEPKNLLAYILRNWSFDLPFFFRPNVTFTNTVVVSMDYASQEKLFQYPSQEWHRLLHAELIKRLQKEGAKAIVFDVLFDEPWTNKIPQTRVDQYLITKYGYTQADLQGTHVDRLFTQAIHEVASNGCPVVFAAGYERKQGFSGEFKSPDPVLGRFPYGSIEFPPTADRIIRQHNPSLTPTGVGDEKIPPLAFVVSELMGRPPMNLAVNRWINYYGKRQTIDTISYHKFFEDNPTALLVSNKVVFVGKEPVVGSEGLGGDEFPTPFNHWTFGSTRGTTGVEIQATAYLNYHRQDWLRQISGGTEFLLFTLVGVVFGFGFNLVRPWVAARVAIASSLLVTIGGIGLVWTTHHWFNWLAMALIQIPAALAWSLVANTKRLYREKAALEQTLATARSALTGSGSSVAEEKPTTFDAPTQGSSPVAIPIRAASPIPAQLAPLAIPDHSLIKCIGKGAYGEVWLAEDIIHSFKAVKVVFRHSFSSDSPYNREFRGLQKFTPISRLHPGLVQILHVGSNEAGGYFYCIMEAGDDEKSGQDINPGSYKPRNLARLIDAQGRLPVRECVDLGLALTDALEFLHQRKLIHRDIKPSNIIFVHGKPKFADVGLVTDLVTRDRDVSFLGTEGFIAPEGPGSAAADVFSLGKVLYEASMGRDRELFPELPTKLDEFPDQEELLLLNTVILQACESEVENRYATAAAMHQDLLGLKARLK